MAQQLLRRPVRTTSVPSLPGLHLPVIRPHRVCSYARTAELPSLCPFRAPQQRQNGRRDLVLSRAADPDTEGEVIAPRETRLPIDQSPLLIDGTGDPRGLPKPSEYQQTLWMSFTIAGIGLHTGEYACVRVRPAYAGEGRYFVRVPSGTNMDRAMREMDDLMEDPIEAHPDNPEGLAQLEDPDYKRELIMRYQEYVDAQEDDGFGGSFMDFLEGQDYTELVERLRTEGPPVYSFAWPEVIEPLKPEEEVFVPATLPYLVGANPVHTCLHNGEEGEREFGVFTVETILSALEACGVDNARIEIEGGVEIPTIDGSADGWARAIFRQGLRCAPPREGVQIWGSDREPLPAGSLGMQADEEEEEEFEEGAEEEGVEEAVEEDEEDEFQIAPTPPGAVEKLVLRPQKVISVCRGSSFVTFYPEDTYRLSAGLNRIETPVIGKQWRTWCMFEDEHYMYSIGDARPWVISPEQAIGMRDAGWLQGGTEGCMLIGFGERWYDPTIVRYQDEPVRHQIQDMIGVLSLMSRSGHSGLPFGHIVGYEADQELLADFAVKLAEETTDADWVSIKEVTGASLLMDYNAVLKDAIEDEGEGAGLEEGAAGEGEEAGQAAYAGDYEEEEGYEEAEAYYAAEADGEDEEVGAAGEEEYEEYEEGGEFEEGEFEDEDEDGIVDVEATPVKPRKR